jgi:copper chaperone CopZ
MKTVFIIISIFISFTAKSQTGIMTQTISVKGNCDDCKERIENAADIKGVKTSIWNKDEKILTVTFDSKKVSLEQIEKAIANAGHSTVSQKANQKAYQKLPDCCKYDDGICKEKK